jgi:hypothetical protein
MPVLHSKHYASPLRRYRHHSLHAFRPYPRKIYRLLLLSKQISVVHTGTLYLIYKLSWHYDYFSSNCFSYLPIRPTSIHRDTTFIAADWLCIFRRTITATPCLVTFVPTRYAGLLHRGEGDRHGIERYYYCGVLGIKSERNPILVHTFHQGSFRL